MNRSVFHDGRALVSWSEWAQQSLVDDYGVDADKVRVLAPGAAPRYFEIGARRQATRRTSGRVRVLFVGGDFERKGGPLLLEQHARAARRALRAARRDAQTRSPPQRNVHVYHGLGPNSPELLRLFAAGGRLRPAEPGRVPGASC